jgi:acyl carrier protein
VRQVNDSLKFKDNLGAGSEEIQQLIAMEETEFGIKFADDAAEKLKTGKLYGRLLRSFVY